MRLLSWITLAVALWTATAAASPPGYKPKANASGSDGPPPFLERPGAHPLSEVLLEAGWAHPFGDLGDDFGSPLGFGATDGVAIGFCWRVYLSSALSLGPAFHFTDFGSYKTTDAVLGDVSIDAFVYRYTVEAMLRTGRADAGVRPFLAAGGGLYRNRVVGLTKGFETSFDQSVNTLGWSARAGFAVGGLEFSAIYHVNRFTSPRFFAPGTELHYDWDSLVVQVGWSVPLGIPMTDDQ